jgi:hypothetical protein
MVNESPDSLPRSTPNSLMYFVGPTWISVPLTGMSSVTMGTSAPVIRLK